MGGAALKQGFGVYDAQGLYSNVLCIWSALCCAHVPTMVGKKGKGKRFLIWCFLSLTIYLRMISATVQTKYSYQLLSTLLVLCKYLVCLAKGAHKLQKLELAVWIMYRCHLCQFYSRKLQLVKFVLHCFPSYLPCKLERKTKQLRSVCLAVQL